MPLLEFELAKGLILSVLLGLAVGVQRELSYYFNDSNAKFTGARSFALIALIGFFAGYFQNKFSDFSIIIALFFGLLVISSFIVRSIKNEKNGATTEFASMCVFVAGFLAAQQNYVVAVFVTVIVLIILEVKQYVLKIRDEISKKDVQSAVLFALITFVMLPIMPNKAIDPYGVFNPYSIWLMIVAISGLSFAGYIVYRAVGSSAGIVVTGILGGLVSSTATTITLAKKVNDVNVKRLALAIGMACTTMFVRIALLMFAIDVSLAFEFCILFFPSALIGYLYIYTSFRKLQNNVATDDVSYENPLEFQSALKLGLIFGLIFGATKLLQEFAGNAGVYLLAFVSGLTDVDAISLAIGQLFANDHLAIFVSISSVLIAVFANTVSKLAISFWIGGVSLSKELAIVLGLPFGISCLIFAIRFL